MTQNKPFSPMNLNEFEKSKMWKIQFSKFVASIRFNKKNQLFGIGEDILKLPLFFSLAKDSQRWPYNNDES